MMLRENDGILIELFDGGIHRITTVANEASRTGIDFVLKGGELIVRATARVEDLRNDRSGPAEDIVQPLLRGLAGEYFSDISGGEAEWWLGKE